MHAHVYGAYGVRSAGMVDIGRTGYAGEIEEVDVPWYVLGPRLFVPMLRRFLSADSASPFDAGGINRYAYASGDPINRIDPSGHASFGWLNRLLGGLIGAVGGAAGTVARTTPTTALMKISQTASVISVATSIGSMTAAALDEAPTAAILGWIAGGSGLASLGLGVASHSIGKGKSDGRAPTSSTPKGLFRRSSARMERTFLPLPSGGAIETFAGKGVVDLPELKGRIRRRSFFSSKKEIKVRWQEHPNSSGGMNYMVDTALSDVDTYNFLKQLGANLPESQPIDVLLGVHGDFRGNNWGRESVVSPFVRKHDDEHWPFDIFAMKLLDRPIGGNIRLHNIAGVELSQVENIVKNEAHVVHGYCFAAVDPKIMKWLNITGTQKSYQL